MEKRDLYGRTEQLERKRIVIANDKKLSKKNKKILDSFYNWGKTEGNKGHGLSDARLLKYFSQLHMIVTWLNKDFLDANKEDIIRIKDDLSKGFVRENGEKFELRRKHSANTQLDYYITMRMFYRWLYSTDFIAARKRLDGDTYPKMVKWLPTTLKPQDIPPHPELLTDEEVDALIQHAYSVRDKALIKVLWGTGARIQEALSMQVKDIIDTDYGYDIKLYGKTGERENYLVDSALLFGAYLKGNVDYIQRNSNAYVWRDTRGKPLEVAAVRKMLMTVARRAKIQKRIYPHLFRHMKATRMVKEGYTEPIIKKYLGWSITSRQLRTYADMANVQTKDAVLKRNGFGSPDKKINEIKVCPHCKKKCDPHLKVCDVCATPFDAKDLVKLAQNKDERIDKLEEKMQAMFNQLIKRMEGSNDSKEWKSLVHQVRDSGANLHTQIEASAENLLDYETNKRPLHELMQKAKVTVERGGLNEE